MPTPRFSKAVRQYGDPIASPKGNARFNTPKLAVPSGSLKVTLASLDQVTANLVQTNGKLVFHSLGDSGGIRGEDWQKGVAEGMIGQFQVDNTGNAVNGPNNPAFFYHLGDVVYWNGLPADYEPQFYDPYKFYPAAIYAIPGNHDGDTAKTVATDPPDPYPTLTGFQMNFVTDPPVSRSPYRKTVSQPYFYWTLDTQFATIIGLYSNIDGTLDETPGGAQQAYLEAQLDDADSEKPVILCVHHPCYSLDNDHGGYPAIIDAIDQAAATAKRWPNLVLSGHVHNYQRFTRTVQNGSIPYIVAGNGGIAATHRQVHQLTRDATGVPVPTPLQTTVGTVSLRAYNEYNPGFLRITVADDITVEYFQIDVDGNYAATLFDSISIDWKGYTITENNGTPALPSPK